MIMQQGFCLQSSIGIDSHVSAVTFSFYLNLQSPSNLRQKKHLPHPLAKMHPRQTMSDKNRRKINYRLVMNARKS